MLKIAHHGSKTSTTKEWLDFWKPRTAVISVGKNNSYGHSGHEVVQLLTERGIRIFRTDGNGEV